jgi:ceramide glucosyltransferase
VDFQAYQNFASFCQQDYPHYELIFGVADPADPIVPVIERLRRDFPERHIRLIVAVTLEANRKASLLHHLANEAKHDILVVSDSDMRATPDYLRQVVAPLANERVGLVTCPYQGESALSFAAGLEALHMGATFLPSVIVARKVLDMRFAMGATVALRLRDLAGLGGFAAMADYLADDYQLGARIAASGLKVRLSNYVMACVLGATTFREQWDREVRWMRCARVSRPLEYPGLLLSFSAPLSVVLAVVNRFEPASLRVLVVSLLLRWVVAWLISVRTGDRQVRRWLPWLPVRDLLSAATWCVGGLGRRITWRGESFVLQAGGRMRPAPAASGQAVADKRDRRFRWFRP